MIQVASQQQMKNTNAKRVLELIRTNKEVSRVAIAKMTKLSPTTISSIVEEWMRKGIVVEKFPMENKGAGRKAISLEINDLGKYIIGMEINHQMVKGTAFNLKNEPIQTVMETIDWKNQEDNQIVVNIRKTVKKLMRSVKDRYDELLGICIGVPALLDAEKKLILSSTVLKVNNLDIHQRLKKYFDFPIFIEDETLLAATAEKEMFERTTSPFIYLSINDGLGASVIINDNYLQGANGDSLEIGHMSLDMNGKQCPCGNKGCFELHVSITELSNKTAQAVAHHSDTIIKELMKNGVMNIEEVILQAVQANDQVGIQIVDEMAVDLGNGVVNLINIFNPQTVVIGGRLSVLGDRLHTGVIKQVEKRAFKSFLERCTVELAQQRDNTVSCGAAIYVLDKVFELQINEML